MTSARPSSQCGESVDSIAGRSVPMLAAGSPSNGWPHDTRTYSDGPWRTGARRSVSDPGWLSGAGGRPRNVARLVQGWQRPEDRPGRRRPPSIRARLRTSHQHAMGAATTPSESGSLVVVAWMRGQTGGFCVACFEHAAMVAAAPDFVPEDPPVPGSMRSVTSGAPGSFVSAFGRCRRIGLLRSVLEKL
jgi:hypothetical protein